MTPQEWDNLPILIVDDVDSARVVLRDMLQELGFQHFVEAKNGHEALDVVTKKPVKIIFCDHLMEGMTGLEFLKALRHHNDRDKTPVIFVSAIGEVSTVEDAIEFGAADYLVKPISFRKLRRKVEEVLHSSECEVRRPYEIGF